MTPNKKLSLVPATLNRLRLGDPSAATEAAETVRKEHAGLSASVSHRSHQESPAWQSANPGRGWHARVKTSLRANGPGARCDASTRQLVTCVSRSVAMCGETPLRSSSPADATELRLAA